MTQVLLDISDKLKTKIEDKFALNVYQLKKAHSLFFFEISVETDPYRIDFPVPISNLILTVDNLTNANDKLMFTNDLNTILGTLYKDESIEIRNLPEINVLYLFTSIDIANIRLWCW